MTKQPASDSEIFRALHAVGRRDKTIRWDLLANRPAILNCREVLRRAGSGASEPDLARHAEEALRDALDAIVDRRIKYATEAALAATAQWEGLPVTERYDLLLAGPYPMSRDTFKRLRIQGFELVEAYLQRSSPPTSRTLRNFAGDAPAPPFTAVASTGDQLDVPMLYVSEIEPGYDGQPLRPIERKDWCRSVEIARSLRRVLRDAVGLVQACAASLYTLSLSVDGDDTAPARALFETYTAFVVHASYSFVPGPRLYSAADATLAWLLEDRFWKLTPARCGTIQGMVLRVEELGPYDTAQLRDLADRVYGLADGHGELFDDNYYQHLWLPWYSQYVAAEHHEADVELIAALSQALARELARQVGFDFEALVDAKSHTRAIVAAFVSQRQQKRGSRISVQPDYNAFVALLADRLIRIAQEF